MINRILCGIYLSSLGHLDLAVEAHRFSGSHEAFLLQFMGQGYDISLALLWRDLLGHCFDFVDVFGRNATK